MQESLTELLDLLITDNNPLDLNVESDVYTPSRGIKACWRYHSTDAYIRDLQPTWLVVLGLLGMLNPSPTRYYANM